MRPYDDVVDGGINVGGRDGRGTAGDGRGWTIDHGHADGGAVRRVLLMIRGRGNGCGRSRCGFRWEVTRVMVVVLLLRRRRRWLLLRVMMMVLLRRLLLVVVVGQRGRELGGVMTGGAGVHRVVVTFSLVHFDAEQFLSGVPLGGVGLLEARQGC